jgi:sodium/potassium/calcium exchanger 6
MHILKYYFVDLIANTVMARQGFPRMGISACFGEPLFITRVLLKRYKQYIGTDQILNVILFDGDFSSYGSSFSTSNMCCG